MVKMAGFADHSHHLAPCHRCTATADEMFDDQGLSAQHPSRTAQTQEEHARDWMTARKPSDHFKQHGARWTEFFRLPYFDVIRMCVIDPMHNLLLGK